MIIENNNKYLLYQKEISTDDGITWIKQDSYKAIDLGYSEECIEPTPSTDTIITWIDGTTSAYTFEEIPESWMEENQDVKEVIIGSNIKTIPSFAFYKCSGLTSVYLQEGVETLGVSCFIYCVNLTTINIPNSVAIIGDNAFRYCKSLTSIIIPEGVKELYTRVLNSCTSLLTVTIPNSVTNIYQYALRTCSSLEEINYNGTISQWNAISKGTNWNEGIPSTCVVHCTDGDIPISEA